MLFGLPRYAIGNSSSCMNCHVNPSGGGMRNDYGSNIYVVDDGKINPTLISINGDTLTVDRLASLDKDNRAKTW